jgi:hypothetical protein
MNSLTACLDGIAVIGPGLADWPVTEAVLTGVAPYVAAATELPVPLALPAAERRRTGRVVRLAMALGLEATRRANVDLTSLATVFASAGGDGDNCHEICQTLASAAGQMSPIRFHNSVHNVTAGYWSIATGSMAASTVLGAYDAGFAAGLLEALTQIAVRRRSVLLIAYDTSYPPPLHWKRPLPDAFGVALLLTPARGANSIAQLNASLDEGIADRLDDTQLEALRSSTPAARCLPLLQSLAVNRARQESRMVQLEYLGTTILRIGTVKY